MNDSKDGDRPGSPSDDPPERDPFEYPADEALDEDEPDSRSTIAARIRWFWTTDNGPVVYVRDVVTSVSIVLLVGLLLFAISGLWPPMVAVESGSMSPNMERGDLIFVIDNERFTPAEAPIYEGESTGVVPADTAEDHQRSKFGQYGDVIIFMPDGSERSTPVIHRAMLWVEADEDWYDRADPQYTDGADDCEALENCPAPHAGFVTLGDANPTYDQARSLPSCDGTCDLVKPEWVVGTAEVRVPYLGYIRLSFSGQLAPGVEYVSLGSEPTSTVRADEPATNSTNSAVPTRFIRG